MTTCVGNQHTWDAFVPAKSEVGRRFGELSTGLFIAPSLRWGRGFCSPGVPERECVLVAREGLLDGMLNNEILSDRGGRPQLHLKHGLAVLIAAQFFRPRRARGDGGVTGLGLRVFG